MTHEFSETIPDLLLEECSERLGRAIVLRPWKHQDADQLLTAQLDPLIRRYQGWLMATRQEAFEWISAQGRRWREGSGGAWAIEADGQLIGDIGFGIKDRDLGIGSIGYWALPEGRGQGIMSDAVKAITHLAFTTAALHRIELWHATENTRSCAVAKRCGFKLEGTARGAMVYPDGDRRSDEHVHARLITDRSFD